MSKSHEARQLQAYVDGELDLASQLTMEERLLRDAGLRAQAQALRDLRAVVHEGATYHTPPAALQQRVAGLAAALTAAPSPRPPRWWAWRPLLAGAGVAALLVLGVDLGLQQHAQGSQDARLLEAVVAGHVRSTLSEHLVDVASSDRHTVKPWLASKLDFSPPVQALPVPGSVFVGGRVDYVDGRPVAALVYRQGGHVVNAFVWPTTGTDTPAAFSTERGYQVAHWSRRQMTHWVISDVNREEFGAVVQALVQADSAP